MFISTEFLPAALLSGIDYFITVLLQFFIKFTDNWYEQANSAVLSLVSEETVGNKSMYSCAWSVAPVLIYD